MTTEARPTEKLNRPSGMADGPIQMLRDPDWQMSYGERAALEGILSQLKPRLAIEIGTGEGGSLARIAEHSLEVHSFDVIEPDPHIRELANVTLHTGNNHELLPELLVRLSDEGRNVDFVLVDGDHSADGVCQDVRTLLDSRAIARTIIVVHDTMNGEVRTGLERVRYEAYPKVAYVELDFVPGYMFREPSLLHELWGGLGLVVVDSRRGAYFEGAVRQSRYFEAFGLMHEAQAPLVERQRLQDELRETRGWLDAVQGSASWRITAPLRGLKGRLGRRT